MPGTRGSAGIELQEAARDLDQNLLGIAVGLSREEEIGERRVGAHGDEVLDYVDAVIEDAHFLRRRMVVRGVYRRDSASVENVGKSRRGRRKPLNDHEAYPGGKGSGSGRAACHISDSTIELIAELERLEHELVSIASGICVALGHNSKVGDCAGGTHGGRDVCVPGLFLAGFGDDALSVPFGD